MFMSELNVLILLKNILILILMFIALREKTLIFTSFASKWTKCKRHFIKLFNNEHIYIYIKFFLCAMHEFIVCII